MSFRETSDIILQICDALSYAHGKGVIHGGIKPRNIYITDDGKVRLLDFGFARLLSSEKRPRFSIGFGIDSYTAPEQLDRKETDIRSDIFALGVVFYHMLTMQEPGGQSRWTPGIEEIIKKCLKPQPNDRFQDIVSFVQALKQVRNDIPGRSEKTGILKGEGHKADRKQDRKKRISSLSIIILITVISVLFSYFVIKKQNQSQSVLDWILHTDQTGTVSEKQREQDDVDISEEAEETAEQITEPLLHKPEEFYQRQETPIIDSLLEKAEEHIRAQRYTSPSGNNAFGVLRDVLTRDPDNKRAQEIVMKIRDIYMTKGDEALRNRDYLIAVTYYQKALYVYPEYSQARKKLKEGAAFLDIVTKKSDRDDRVSPDIHSEKDIGYLLTEAEEQFKAQRYTSPPGNNAFAVLRDVLTRDPDNKRAQEIVMKIRDIYMTKGEEALRNRDYLIAATYYQKALYVYPGYLPAEEKLNEINSLLRDTDS
jgi:tetratricopeptide (TPR) repeat protein